MTIAGVKTCRRFKPLRSITNSGLAREDQFLLVPAANVSELSGALLEVIRDEKLRRTLAVAAREQATNEFGLKKYRERIELVLNRSLRQGHSDVEASYSDVRPAASELHI